MKIRKKYVILLMLLICISAIAMYKDVIFQEGNPLPIINGMIKLYDDNTYVVIGKNPNVYLTKTDNKDDLLKFIEKEYDVKFKEQLGSGHLFEAESTRLILTSRQYTRFYQIWRLSLVANKLQ